MLPGLMQNCPLLISTLIEHAAKYHSAGEIVSRTVEGPIHRCTDGYMRIADRAKEVIKSGGEWITSIDLENAAIFERV